MQVTISKPSQQYSFKRLPKNRVMVVRSFGKVGRNDPCPCGSGKKYKRCHLSIQEGR